MDLSGISNNGINVKENSNEEYDYKGHDDTFGSLGILQEKQVRKPSKRQNVENNENCQNLSNIFTNVNRSFCCGERKKSSVASREM